ncbi:MAG: nucleotide pyrophosphohydrolase [Bacteroidota bacterium]
MKRETTFFDSAYSEKEQLPREFTVIFETLTDNLRNKTKVSVNGIHVGDIIDDNSMEKDGYRFHDVFHYTFAALLGWSPCTRSMMQRKRKSVPQVDEIEDGARATITEEAISLLLFNEAKQSNLFENRHSVNSHLLDQIKNLTSSFEVSIRSKQEWETAILTGYSLFRNLVNNDGGKVYFDMNTRTAIYEQ